MATFVCDMAASSTDDGQEDVDHAYGKPVSYMQLGVSVSLIVECVAG
jgi:hypothetical protein